MRARKSYVLGLAGAVGLGLAGAVGLGLAGAVGLAALTWRARASSPPPRTSVERTTIAETRPTPTARRASSLLLPIAPSGWPYRGARLIADEPVFPPGFGVARIYIDAGHGAPANTGNRSCFCIEEQRFTLEAATALAERLDAMGHFETRVSRGPDEEVPYPARVEAAEIWGADAFISLHSDVRGRLGSWSPRPDTTCPISLSAPGFAVLWSDEGAATLCDRRLALARAFARRMEQAGLLPYNGAAYTGLYEGDAAQPGVFVDRHALAQRIFVLRRPTMPSILVETHHALDPREASLWTESETLDAFAAAVAFALLDVLGEGHSPPT